MAAVPVEEYLKTIYEADMEYVDGQLVERHVGEYFHSLLQLALGAELRARARQRGFRVFSEQRVRVSAEPRYRIPDICGKALPHKITPILERPDLMIEILSTDDRVSDMLKKISDYLGAGISHIWLVDPYQRAIFTADESGIREVTGNVLETEMVGAVDFRALFAELDEPTE